LQIVSPAGPVYQAGPLSGNPIAMTAGIKTLEKISQPGFFDELGAKAQKLVDGLIEAAKAYDFNFHAKCVGGRVGVCF
ncbi:aspartate aminotransferase family protein, partial [Francisella tularensis subsp. holarctica]|nr:aspartate aminotransferase family protein [Francisella tularensis subsp. holarctica]